MTGIIPFLFLMLLISSSMFMFLNISKKRSLKTIPLLLSLFVITGCSQVSTTDDFSKQYKLQDAHHWKLLAEDVARQVKFCLYNKDFDPDIPIYLEEGDGTPFDNIFRSLVISELQNRKVNSCELRRRLLFW